MSVGRSNAWWSGRLSFFKWVALQPNDLWPPGTSRTPCLKLEILWLFVLSRVQTCDSVCVFLAACATDLEEAGLIYPPLPSSLNAHSSLGLMGECLSNFLSSLEFKGGNIHGINYRQQSNQHLQINQHLSPLAFIFTNMYNAFQHVCKCI